MFNRYFLMLGEKCNFQCKYCMQHPIHTAQLKNELSMDVIDYIVNNAISSKDNNHIMFYGGEPLLYFENIKEIMGYLKGIPNLTFGVISNGDLLNQEMVDFFNLNKISFMLSNDGANTTEFRGKNMFEDANFIELSNQLDKFGVSSVLHAKNCDPYTIWEYLSEKGIDVERNYIDLIMDSGLKNQYLVEFDWDEFGKIVKRMEDDIYHSLTTGEPRAVMHVANPIISRTAQIAGKDNLSINYDMLLFPKCGVGRTTCNLDLEGNVYLCHNSSQKIGTIYDSYETLVENFLPYDKYARSEECCVCEVQTACSGGCILVGDDARKKYYCKMIKMYFGSAINALKRLNALDPEND